MQVKDILEGTAALIVILGVPPIAAKNVARMWRRSTFGRRRAQARLLDQLACGEPITRVETWLGFAVVAEGDTRTYELPGAWVQVTEANEVVASFSVTIRSSRMWYDASRLTVGNLPIRLGRSTFSDIDPRGTAPDSAYAEGNRRVGYVQSYYFGNPGHYQAYVVGYNIIGAGGVSAGYSDAREADAAAQAVAMAGTTVNTLVVYGPQTAPPAPLDAFVGVEGDHIRLRLGRGTNLRIADL
ncbi:hypothetical protein OG474_38610 [Kribbella sp. NBC_01505]|uniref:ETEC_3214 domain-containing protein n=1 Tax=Kribbella sp. NBC_01505 TaxID=2903580 RepID=UPI003867C454